MLADEPEQIVGLGQATLAAGTGFTVMTTVFVVEQVPLDSVKEYVVVAVGDTLGLDTVEVNPVGLDVHE